jgi:hypothetical protein
MGRSERVSRVGLIRKHIPQWGTGQQKEERKTGCCESFLNTFPFAASASTLKLKE